MNDEDVTSEDRFADALAGALQHVANEALMLAKLEEFLSPSPAKLSSSQEEADTINLLVDALTRLHGGAPRIIIQGINDPKPVFDTYLSAALDESVEVFHRARRSLCRAHAFMVGASMLKSSPEFLSFTEDPKIRAVLSTKAESTFWEHAEITYIRLAGFWDRLGQILDFSFFAIRQYERDGFSAVIDRIRANTLRMHPELEQNPSWRLLWNHKRSEKEDGLQWLLSRRNMLVHSLHLRPVTEDQEDELFESTFNHLDARLRRDLSPGTPELEIQRLHSQLAQAAKLFPEALRLCKVYTESKF